MKYLYVLNDSVVAGKKKNLFEAQLTVFFEAELLIQPAGNFQISQEAANDVPLSAK